MTDELKRQPTLAALASDTGHPTEQTSGPPVISKRAFLVAEGRLLRDCIERVLRRPDLLIISDYINLDQLHESADLLPAPDLIMLSIGASEFKSTFARVRELRMLWPSSRWIVLSRSSDLEFIRYAVTSGVEGFLHEDSPVEVLCLLTELVLLGHSLLPTQIAGLFKDEEASSAHDGANGHIPLSQHGRADAGLQQSQEGMMVSAPLGRGSRSLSQRELDILACLAQGHSNKKIARDLVISEATVKAHVKALLRKMQVANRTQAAIAAPRFLFTMDKPRPSMSLAHTPTPPSASAYNGATQPVRCEASTL